MDEGMKARVRPVIIEGVIADKRFDPRTGEKSVQLVWTSKDGEEHDRWFSENELELVSEASLTA